MERRFVIDFQDLEHYKLAEAYCTQDKEEALRFARLSVDMIDEGESEPEEG